MFSHSMRRGMTRAITSLQPASSLASASRIPCLSSSSLLKTAAAGYHERVIDHYENPRNVGSMNVKDPDVGTGLVGAPACGDVMKLQLRVDPATGVITEARFKTFGCGSAIASSSLATELAKGRSVDDVLRIKNSDIAKHLSLPPVKLHCSMLAEDAIKAAVKDYKTKRAAAAALTAAEAGTVGQQAEGQKMAVQAQG